jgi:hypothetical protein
VILEVEGRLDEVLPSGGSANGISSHPQWCDRRNCRRGNQHCGSAFVDQHGTEVKVIFHETAGGTRVTLEHSGLSGVPGKLAETLAQYAWRRLPLSFRRAMASFAKLC